MLPKQRRCTPPRLKVSPGLQPPRTRVSSLSHPPLLLSPATRTVGTESEGMPGLGMSSSGEIMFSAHPTPSRQLPGCGLSAASSELPLGPVGLRTRGRTD